MSDVQFPVERGCLAPLTWADLSKHNISDSHLLELVLTVRLVVLFINHECRSESDNISIYQGASFFTVFVLVVHIDSQ